MVYNSDDIDALYPTVARQNSVANSFPVKYLVITNEELKPAFQRLANWKTTKGVKSKVLTVEEISQRYSDPIMPMRIKRAIMEYKGQVEYVKGCAVRDTNNCNIEAAVEAALSPLLGGCPRRSVLFMFYSFKLG
mgnify:CR=1 FL=1